MAAIIHDGDNGVLAVLRTSDHKSVAAMNLQSAYRTVGSYTWDSSTRLVVSLGYDDSTWGQIVNTGELMSLDIPTNTSKYLLGSMARAEPSFGSHIRGSVATHRYNSGYGFVLNSTPETPGSVVVVTRNWHGDARQQVQLLDTGNGAINPIATSPATSEYGADFLTDQQGALRYATITNYGLNNEFRLFRRSPDGTDWVSADDLTKSNLYPIWISRDQTWTYFTSDNNRLPGRFCLSRKHTDGSGPLEQISCQDDVNFLETFESLDGNSLIATYAEPGLPAMNVLGDNADTDIVLALQASLDNALVIPVSKTLDGHLWVLKAISDRDPGTYYLYNRTTKNYETLFHAYQDLPLAVMRPTRAVRYTARDGTVIHGFLTLPVAGRDSRKPPLVVLPHGGPVDVRDSWFYNRETQLLATHGYAVLRVNFRGSSGYGWAFRTAAKKQWGKALIDDITDGVHHVVKQGLVDPDRIGIYGASYGGYAALMSGVREPELYKAVVTYAGVSDLAQELKDDDNAQYEQSSLYQDKYIGNDPAELKAQSPLTYIDRLKAPVMIVHGMDDKRVPYSQATTLRSALDERKHPYEWFVRSGEGHGFSHLDNRQAFNEALLVFLDKNLRDLPPPVSTGGPTAGQH